MVFAFFLSALMLLAVVLLLNWAIMPFTERLVACSWSPSVDGGGGCVVVVTGSHSRKSVSSAVNNNGVIPSASGVTLVSLRNLMTRGFRHNSSFFTTSFNDTLAGSSSRNGVFPNAGTPLHERRMSPGNISSRRTLRSPT